MPLTKPALAARALAAASTGRLHFGDNLVVLRHEIEDECADLIYLDPPFNSNVSYNVLFKTPKGHDSGAQLRTFDDTWQWGPQAAKEFDELLHQGNTNVAEMMGVLRNFLHDSDMMAYLTMMANRLLEMHRVLKPTGGLYLHCDPTASHYLKVVLDGIFGAKNFRTEISWRRQSAHNDAKQGRKQPGNVRDVLLFYTKSDTWKWNWQYTPYTEQYKNDFYKFVEPETDRRYRLSDITAPGGDSPEKKNPQYEFLGVTRYWRYSRERMKELHEAGRIVQTGPGRVPAYKRYLDEMPGVPIQNDWDDIRPASGNESLGYQTQKPLALLDRIILSSTDEGDLVLDPFCGCGTAVHSAQKLGRRWIGIDITHLAIGLIESRLRRAFPELELDVRGTPEDIEGARDLAQRDKYQFQWWACSLVKAQPFGGKRKGADTGIDGLIFFRHDARETGKIVVSVKGGESITPTMLRELGHVVQREKAAIGLLVTLSRPSRNMIGEASGTGFYTWPVTGDKFPKLQILTVEGLLSGTEQAQYPPLSEVEATVRSVKREEQVPEQAALFQDKGSSGVMDRRMALTCTLVNRLADEPHFGRVKLAKLFYLADATRSLDLGTVYERKAAGPLDTKAMYDAEIGLENFAKQHGYLSVYGDGRKITYKRGPNIGDAYHSAGKVLGKENRTAVNKIINLFHKATTDQCEIAATLFACWNDLLIERKEATDDAIIAEFRNAWHEEKRRFSQERLKLALDWMRKKKLTPTGQGASTKAGRRGRSASTVA